MPWKCPACSTPIRQQLQASGHEAPRPACIYRCSVCRLELLLSDDGLKLVVAPLPHVDADDKIA
jgi:hypothetical protein